MSKRKAKAANLDEARSGWDVKPSIVSMRTSNPIRKIVDKMICAPNPLKEKVSLSIGDPTVFGNFKCPDHFHDTLNEMSRSLKYNGYPPAPGYPDARKSVAETHTSESAPLEMKDVFLTSGCSHALEMAFAALADEGMNVLLPKPGFSLYKTICDSKGIEVRMYNLVPERNWEMDLEQMETLIDSKTACVLVNNPSNPCGSVFSASHLTDFLAVCERHFLPVISDEIYENMAFEKGSFVPLANLSTEVPILTTGGLAKQYMAPGWRIGWVLIHDRHDRFKQVRVGLDQLATIILGPNSLLQACTATVVKDTPQEYYDGVLNLLKHNAEYCLKRAKAIEGVTPITPQGAMYMMCKLDIENMDVEDDVDFCKKMLAEESVALLPGSCFGADNYFRVVVCPPEDKLCAAWDRITEFCARHKTR